MALDVERPLILADRESSRRALKIILGMHGVSFLAEVTKEWLHEMADSRHVGPWELYIEPFTTILNHAKEDGI